MAMFRLSGLSSGLDTENLINQLMQIERRPVTLMEQKQHLLELRKELWKETNTNLLSLFDKVKSLIKPETFQVKSTTISDDTVVRASANKDAVSNVYDISVTNLAKAHQLSGAKQGSATTALGLSGNFTISDGVYSSDITVAAQDSLTTIVSKINNAKDKVDPEKNLRVTASIVDNTLVLKHDFTGTIATGTNNNITLSDSADLVGLTDNTEVLESLGLVNDAKAVANQLQAAEDATFTVNSINVTRGSNTALSDVINGVTLDLLKEGASSSITVANDTETMTKSVKAFVDAYNSTMELINTRLSEEKVKDATTDINLRKGLLRGDSLLVSAKSQLRMNTADPITGMIPYNSLSDIGITTSKDDFGKSGKLVLDEAKLKEALESDPEAVYKLFLDDTDNDGNVDSGEKGIAARLYNQLEGLVSTKTTSIGGVSVAKGMIASRLGSFDRQIKDYSKQIEAFELRLEKVESNLWKKFTEMEKALSTLGNQASWLTGQLAGLMNSE